MAPDSDFTSFPADDNDIGNDNDTDYGSEFSPEEEQIVERLLAGEIDIEDNPIAIPFEQNDAHQALRISRVFGKERKGPLYAATSAAESITVQNGQIAQYPDRKFLACPFIIHSKCSD